MTHTKPQATSMLEQQHGWMLMHPVWPGKGPGTCPTTTLQVPKSSSPTDTVSHDHTKHLGSTTTRLHHNMQVTNLIKDLLLDRGAVAVNMKMWDYTAAGTPCYQLQSDSVETPPPPCNCAAGTLRLKGSQWQLLPLPTRLFVVLPKERAKRLPQAVITAATVFLPRTAVAGLCCLTDSATPACPVAKAHAAVQAVVLLQLSPWAASAQSMPAEGLQQPYGLSVHHCTLELQP